MSHNPKTVTAAVMTTNRITILREFLHYGRQSEKKKKHLNEMVHISRGNRQFKLCKISITGLFGETKAKTDILRQSDVGYAYAGHVQRQYTFRHAQLCSCFP